MQTMTSITPERIEQQLDAYLKQQKQRLSALSNTISQRSYRTFGSTKSSFGEIPRSICRSD